VQVRDNTLLKTKRTIARETTRAFRLVQWFSQQPANVKSLPTRAASKKRATSIAKSNSVTSVASVPSVVFFFFFFLFSEAR
jgi:hypothetical protein